MRPESIFAPVAVLVFHTLLVTLYTGYKRFSAGFAGRVKGSDFRYGETANVPPDVTVANRNLMNLLEVPVLFYVAALASYTTGHVTIVTLYLAWLFVGLRVVHTFIHIAYNRILYRFAAYASSCLVLLALWLWFVAAVFG
ncbi:MAG TPA: MAPEG family protein [Gammaproteobacteria bacterium]|jgi:hypothetical protein|nr:MAPEG family protein [Gammaproteobacteria bacterium]